MNSPQTRAVNRWAIALHARGKHRQAHIYIRRRTGESEPLYQTRAEAREAAAKLRCLGAMLFGIGGPLNDDRYGCTSEIRKIFREIAEELWLG